MRRQQTDKMSQPEMSSTPGIYILVMHLEQPIPMAIG